MAGPTVQSIFSRIDTRPDGALTRDEVKSMVEKAKVGGGIFGGIKVNQATDAFMEQLDANKDGKIDLGEVTGKMKDLVLALGQQTPPGQPVPTVPEVAMEWFQRADTSGDGKLSQAEIKAPIKKALEDAGQSMADTKADIAAKIGLYLLDEDKSGAVSKDEVLSLAQDVQRQTEPPAPPPPAPPVA